MQYDCDDDQEQDLKEVMSQEQSMKVVKEVMQDFLDRLEVMQLLQDLESRISEEDSDLKTFISSDSPSHSGSSPFARFNVSPWKSQASSPTPSSSSLMMMIQQQEPQEDVTSESSMERMKGETEVSGGSCPSHPMKETSREGRESRDDEVTTPLPADVITAATTRRQQAWTSKQDSHEDVLFSPSDLRSNITEIQKACLTQLERNMGEMKKGFASAQEYRQNDSKGSMKGISFWRDEVCIKDLPNLFSDVNESVAGRRQLKEGKEMETTTPSCPDHDTLDQEEGREEKQPEKQQHHPHVTLSGKISHFLHSKDITDKTDEEEKDKDLDSREEDHSVHDHLAQKQGEEKGPEAQREMNKNEMMNQRYQNDHYSRLKGLKTQHFTREGEEDPWKAAKKAIQSSSCLVSQGFASSENSSKELEEAITRFQTFKRKTPVDETETILSKEGEGVSEEPLDSCHPQESSNNRVEEKHESNVQVPQRQLLPHEEEGWNSQSLLFDKHKREKDLLSKHTTSKEDADEEREEESHDEKREPLMSPKEECRVQEGKDEETDTRDDDSKRHHHQEYDDSVHSYDDDLLENGNRGEGKLENPQQEDSFKVLGDNISYPGTEKKKEEKKESNTKSLEKMRESLVNLIHGNDITENVEGCSSTTEESVGDPMKKDSQNKVEEDAQDDKCLEHSLWNSSQMKDKKSQETKRTRTKSGDLLHNSLGEGEVGAGDSFLISRKRIKLMPSHPDDFLDDEPSVREKTSYAQQDMTDSPLTSFPDREKEELKPETFVCSKDSSSDLDEEESSQDVKKHAISDDYPDDDPTIYEEEEEPVFLPKRPRVERLIRDRIIIQPKPMTDFIPRQLSSNPQRIRCGLSRNYAPKDPLHPELYKRPPPGKENELHNLELDADVESSKKEKKKFIPRSY